MRRLPPIDKAKSALVDSFGKSEAVKTPPTPEVKSDDLSIDSLMSDGLIAINRLMKTIMTEIQIGSTERDVVQNLSDIMKMLRELKKDEQAILDNLSTEELEKIANEKGT